LDRGSGEDRKKGGGHEMGDIVFHGFCWFGLKRRQLTNRAFHASGKMRMLGFYFKKFPLKFPNRSGASFCFSFAF
jgi:hypothetical protein